jgi:hypothetical protein
VFEIVSSYKGLVIGLILITGEIQKVELFEETCAEFWDKHVVEHERKFPIFRQERTYHTFKGEIVVGYHCSDIEPR